MPTRNDGRPLPDADDYRMLLFLAWLAAPVAQVFLTAAFVGAHRSPQDRAGYLVSWPVCCVVAAVATAVFALCLRASQRHGGRAAAIAESPRRRWDARAEANYEETRVAYFGKRRASLLIAVTPAFLALPLFLTGYAQAPSDPATGQPVINPAALAFGFFNPFAIILLRYLTGRTLTLMAIAAWIPWAWFAQDARETAAAWAGLGTSATIVVGLLLNITLGRRM